MKKKKKFALRVQIWWKNWQVRVCFRKAWKERLDRSKNRRFCDIMHPVRNIRNKHIHSIIQDRLFLFLLCSNCFITAYFSCILFTKFESESRACATNYVKSRHLDWSYLFFYFQNVRFYNKITNYPRAPTKQFPHLHKVQAFCLGPRHEPLTTYYWRGPNYRKEFAVYRLFCNKNQQKHRKKIPED